MPKTLQRHTTLFTPGDQLPTFIQSVGSMSQGPHLYIQLDHHGPDDITLQKGWAIGQVECAQILAPIQAHSCGSPVLPEIPKDVPSPLHAVQLKNLLLKYQDIFSQHKDDLGFTLLAEHEIHTE